MAALSLTRAGKQGAVGIYGNVEGSFSRVIAEGANFSAPVRQITQVFVVTRQV